MRERAARFPTVPTLMELGFPIDGESSYGIAGPRGMDPGVVAILHDAFRDALHDPAHLAVIARFDMPLRYLDTAAYRAHVTAENEAEKRLMVEIGAPRN
jgi:tripartite-type tricarboxylate transporter receptor subunit TctC